MTSKIEDETKVRDDEGQNAYRECSSLARSATSADNSPVFGVEDFSDSFVANSVAGFQNLILRFLVPRTLQYFDTVQTPTLRSSRLFEHDRSFNKRSHLYTLSALHIRFLPCFRCRSTWPRHRPSTRVCPLSATLSIA